MTFTHRLSALTTVTAFLSYNELIKIQLQNLDQNSASKSWPKFSFKISTKLPAQNITKIQVQNVEQLRPPTNIDNWVAILISQNHISQVH